MQAIMLSTACCNSASVGSAMVPPGWTAGAAVHEVLRIHGGDSGFDFNRFRFEGRWNDIMVYLDGNRDLAGCGKTRGEAVLDAVMAHGSSVGISVAMPQSAAEPAHESSSPLPSGR